MQGQMHNVTVGQTGGGDSEMQASTGEAGVPRLAYSAKELSDRLGVSVRHIRRMQSAALLPKPIRLGRSVRWPVDVINAWMAAGAPDRRRWERINSRSDRGTRP